MKKSKWLSPITKQTFPTIRLFCFPYSGGSAQIFKTWAEHLPPTIQLCGIQYPGRGARFGEAPITSMEGMVAPLRESIKPFLDIPFAFYGHSLGGGIAFELTRQLQKEKISPKHLFISGRNAPHLPRKTAILHNLPEEQFRIKMRTLGGTSPEILDHPELMDLVSPLVRADFTISETYTFTEGEPIPCPLSVYGGQDDPLVSVEGIQQWERYAANRFDYHIFPGAHFFLDSCRAKLVTKIVALLGV